MAGLQQSIVVFSKNYLPITEINIKRAIALLITGKAEPLLLSAEEEQSTIAVHSPSMVLEVPTQIRLTVQHRERIWKVPNVTRREILRRDQHRCQYCGATKHLTMDHVMPRSRGGEHSWTNVVAACKTCNHSKGNRTPEEAGMTLMTPPKTPMHPVIAFAEAFWRAHKQRQMN